MTKFIIAIAVAASVLIGANIGLTIHEEVTDKPLITWDEKYNDNLYFQHERHNKISSGDDVSNYYVFEEDKEVYDEFLNVVINKKASFYTINKEFKTREDAKNFLKNLTHTKEFYFSNCFDMTITYPVDSFRVIVDVESVNNAYNENITNLNKIKGISSQIISDNMTESEVLIAINKYLTDTITYDVNKTTLTDALNGNVRCSGYASLFKALAEINGIKTDIEVGTQTADGIHHSWCKVYLNDTIVYFDPTYNDGSSSTDYSFMTKENLMKDRTYIDTTTYLLRDGYFIFD